VLSAAGLGADVPHGVQHGLSTRVKTIIDHAVAEYTSLNLPMLQAELDQQAARNRARSYRPSEGLDPEFEGLPLDPDPVPGAPFLFTIGGLAEEADADVPDLPPLTDEAKAALRQEVGLADDYANMIGREVCAVLLHHRLRIQASVAQYVEPQIAAMLEELTRSLDAPFDPNGDAAQIGAFFAGPTDWASRDELVDRALAFGLGGTREAATRGVFQNSRVRADGRVEWKHHFAHLANALAADPDAAASAAAQQQAIRGALTASGWDDLAAVTAPITPTVRLPA
jgi:hypothetical protein